MSDPLSLSRERLVLETASRVRQAIIRRAELLQPAIARYDAAVNEQGSVPLPDALFLIIMASSMTDPVSDVLRQYVELDRVLKSVEGE